MPNCFQLVRKGSKEPSILQKVDEELCRKFDTPVHEILWFRGWYDIIGFSLACGKTFDQIRQKELEYSPESDLLEVIDYLEQNFEADSWVEVGRR